MKKLIPVLSLLFLILTFSCKKEDNGQLAVLSLDSTANELLYSAEAYATLISDGGTSIDSFGFCWNTAPLPTLLDSCVVCYDTADFHGILRGLLPATTYHVRAFVANAAGTSYSNEITLTTWDGFLKDVDYHTYRGVQIGNQGWMAENLKATHYSDGTAIRFGKPCNYCYWYAEGHSYGSDREADLDQDGDLDWDDNQQYIETFGLLYTWYAAVNLLSPTECNSVATVQRVAPGVEDVCPDGWHLPTQDEFTELTMTVDSDAGALMSDSLWYTNPGTNSSGFNALPGGGMNYDGEFYNLFASTSFKSSTPANSVNAYFMGLSASGGLMMSLGGKKCASAIRCVKDR